MTATDILRIAGTVAVTQAICDLLAYRLVYSQEPYKRCVSALERSKARRDKAVLSDPAAASSAGSGAAAGSSKSQSKSLEKSSKKVARAEEEYASAAADVVKRHTVPSIVSSILFLILYRVMSAEYSGRVIAVLPFQPWSLLRRLSFRGLLLSSAMFELVRNALPDTQDDLSSLSPQKVAHIHQACAFAFIYILCTFSVKYLIHDLVGRDPPKGADGGIAGTLLDDPNSKRLLKSFGLNEDDLKEVRKGL